MESIAVTNNQTPKRPTLRYHGGKWRLAKWVIQHFPPHRVYVEPYGGAASVLIQKSRSYAEIYNELDPDPVEQARRTIAKSFMGFGSNAIHCGGPRGMRTRASTWKAPTGFRNNSNRSGTTPAHDWMHYPEQLEKFVNRLAGVVVENKPAIEVINQHDTIDTLHYVDPPYVFSTRADSYDDYKFEMSDEQHKELSIVLHSLKGMVVLSGYRSGMYEELYGDWMHVEHKALSDGSRARTECLWLSPAVAKHQLKLF